MSFTPTSVFTHENATQQLAAGLAAIDAGQSAFAFNQTNSIDSSAVACMLAWQRHAQQRGVKLEFQQLPINLTNLIALYGVAEFL
ncbi:STAS domain-containing protein [Solimicrobium silvestre]|uniref:STAS domain n=1 Tax=Solimicrobium silvestre TaxID=2099400 RepID=A0A2S9H247_9BURK|nr:STAS domain-containing protein [Solimicrobium silvestre]PRC94013.1 STAS domain [Solimicrobium silvestre]